MPARRRPSPCSSPITSAGALAAPHGKLLVWATPWHRQRVLSAPRALLELPFEELIVSHGEPVHDRAAFERAIELDPWGG